MTKTAEDSARKGALRLLSGVSEGLSLSDQNRSLQSLSPPDQARAGRLAAEVLRYRQSADAVIATYVNRTPAPQILDVLRLAVVEMLHLGAAPHGVVNSAVNLVRGMGKRGQAAAGMVNAVLRKVSRHEGWADLPPQRLPDWLRETVVTAYGETATQAIEAAHQAGASLDLTAKPGLSIEGAETLPTGSLRLRGPVQVSTLPGYSEGNWWVQDAAAALPVRLLAPQKGEYIADICAAPGGKTLQLAASGAEVTAVDVSAVRMRRVSENLRRCGLSANLVTADAMSWTPPAPLDAVLLDAPCSATGTIRRHPDLPFLRDGSGISELVAVQSQLIDRALAMLRPGGRMVYAVCSLLPDEGEAQIRDALTRHSGLNVEAPDLPGIDPAWISGGGIRLRPDYWPELGGMDGFFMVRLRKA